MPVVQWLADGSTEELLDTRPGRPERRGRRAGLDPRRRSRPLAVVAARRCGSTRATRIAAGDHDTAAVPAPSRWRCCRRLVPEGATPAVLVGSTLYVVRGASLLTRATSAAAPDQRAAGARRRRRWYVSAARRRAGRAVWIVHTLPGRISIFAYDLAGQREIREVICRARSPMPRCSTASCTSAPTRASSGSPIGRPICSTGCRSAASRAIVADPSRHRLLLARCD